MKVEKLSLLFCFDKVIKCKPNENLYLVAKLQLSEEMRKQSQVMIISLNVYTNNDLFTLTLKKKKKNEDE